jgi:hypothetical protein
VFFYIDGVTRFFVRNDSGGAANPMWVFVHAMGATSSESFPAVTRRCQRADCSRREGQLLNLTAVCKIALTLEKGSCYNLIIKHEGTNENDPNEVH